MPLKEAAFYWVATVIIMSVYGSMIYRVLRKMSIFKNIKFKLNYFNFESTMVEAKCYIVEYA